MCHIITQAGLSKAACDGFFKVIKRFMKYCRDELI
jgi:hypothetical protein